MYQSDVDALAVWTVRWSRIIVFGTLGPILGIESDCRGVNATCQPWTKVLPVYVQRASARLLTPSAIATARAERGFARDEQAAARRQGTARGHGTLHMGW